MRMKNKEFLKRSLCKSRHEMRSKTNKEMHNDMKIRWSSYSTLPGEGSWTFQNTQVSTTSRPPSFAFCIRSSHIYTHYISPEIRNKTSNSPTKKTKKGRRNVYLRSASWVMYGTREENSPLPINQNSLPVICHTTLNKLNTQKPEQPQNQHGKLGNRVGCHSEQKKTLNFLGVEGKVEMQRSKTH